MAKKKSYESEFKKLDFFIIGSLLLLALIFRLYKINIPLADHHSWRQADTAAVARNFVKDNFNLLLPKYDDLSNIQSGKYNPQGYRLVEFPLYNAFFALLYKFFPFFPLEVYGRLVTIAFSLILIFIIYYLVLKEEGRVSAFFSSLIFALMPFFVFYSRTILPEMTAISLAFGSILMFYFYKEKTKSSFFSFIYYFLSLVFFSLSLLIKPTTIFFVLPIIYLFYKKFGIVFLKKIVFYLFFLSFLPFFLWRIWIIKYPEGIPATEWLFFSVNTSEGLKNIFFKPAFFRWIFKERIINIILGGYLIAFLIAGILKKPKRSLIFFSIGLSSLLYLFIFQGGNVQHDYYQILILPTLAMFSGIGISFFLSGNKIFTHFLFNLLIITLLICFSFFFSYYEVKNFYSYPHDLITTANIIKTLTKEKDKIITDTLGDTTLLYLSERKGYPALTDNLENLKNHQLKYFVTFNKELAESLKNNFNLIFESNKVFIFKL